MGKDIYQIMAEMQHGLNLKTAGPDYLEKKLRWNSAILKEAAELIESYGFEWWKKQERDMDNVRVETIDLLHFIISSELTKNFSTNKDNFIDVTADSLRVAFKEGLADGADELDLLDLMDEIVKDNLSRFALLKESFKKQDMSNEIVYISYITKNCLNRFRQNNGYKDGTYLKMWNGVEDNVIAFDMAEKIGADVDLFDKLYGELTKKYNLLKN